MKTVFTRSGLLVVFCLLGHLLRAQSAGPNNAVGVINDNSYGSVAWHNLEGVQAEDVAPATASVSLNTSESDISNYLIADDFGFSIPLTATVTGISVDVLRRASNLAVDAAIKDDHVYIVKAGLVMTTEDRALPTDWPTSYTTESYGSPSDDWGLPWLPLDINDPAFGIALSVGFSANLQATVSMADIDAITITIHYNDIPLPITLTSFTGEFKDQGVRLAWETETETNSDYFVVERSVSSTLQWKSIAQVKAAGTSFSLKQYTAEDPSPADMNYYRLRQVDKNNRVEYSPILFVDCTREMAPLTVQPNPASDFVKVLHKEAGEYLELYTAQGRLVKSYSENKNETSADISLVDLDAGVYILKAYGKNSVRSNRFVIIR